MKLKVVLCGLLLLLAMLSIFDSTQALASDVKVDPGNITRRGGVDPGVQTNAVVASILSGVYQVSGMVAVLMLVIGGVRYVISDGDPARAQSARKTIIYALIGLVIIGSAFIITGIVQGLFV